VKKKKRKKKKGRDDEQMVDWKRRKLIRASGGR
jgi:hypothetical protein